jgi:AGZA family xanthine/uracil permease-like MFS transporter
MFQIRERQSTVGREILGGLTTFMAMSYIIFVQVTLLSKPECGMDPNGVMMATCLAAAIACILMGIWANYPIGLAPGMGENFFFALTLAPIMSTWGHGPGWQMALSLTATAGALFLLLSLVKIRARVLNAIPDSLKSGIAAGIGLFIAVVGLNMGNVVSKNPHGAMTMIVPFQGNEEAWLTFAGLAIIVMLTAFRVRGAILLGILATTAVAMLWGRTNPQVPVAMPTGLDKTAGGFIAGFGSLYQVIGERWVEVGTALFILLFMDLFDTVGTLVGVSQRAGLMRDGKLPRAERALAADASGTLAGAALGTSTVTSYIESITGVQAGARTGLAAVVVGICMLAAVFFQPLVEMVIGDFRVSVNGESIQKFPTIAPALIVVGALMMRAIRDIDWDEITESIPAFLTLVTIPLAYSIADGIAIGFISYAAGKLLAGRPKECPVLVYVFAVLLSLKFVLPPLS